MTSPSVFKLPWQFDHTALVELYKDLALDVGQVYLTSMDGNTYTYSAEKVKHADAQGRSDLEWTFNKVNTFFRGTYAEEVFNTVNQHYGVCRTRFMLLDTHRRAYSNHRDSTNRLHIPLYTNSDCVFISNDIVHHMDCLGQLYFADTQTTHTAANFGHTDRLHLVFSLIDPNVGASNILKDIL